MKTIAVAIIALLTLTGCKNSNQRVMNCENEKAKAILWVDYNKDKLPLPDGTILRTAKVLAEVSPFGSVKIIAFCKEQELEVVDYLVKRLEVYTIRPEILEQGFVKPGEQQFLQLRYVPGWMKE